jgi:hypothetical protein
LQIALAYIRWSPYVDGQKVALYYVARNARHIEQGRLESVAKDQVVQSDLAGTIIKRFEKF